MYVYNLDKIISYLSINTYPDIYIYITSAYVIIDQQDKKQKLKHSNNFLKARINFIEKRIRIKNKRI